MYRRRSRVLLAVLVLVTLVLITVDFRSGDEGPLATVRGFATSVFGPVQDGLATVLRPIGDAVGGVGDLFALRAENDRLRGRLEELEERRRSFESLEQENTALRDLLEMKERTDYGVIAARVISWGPSNFEWTITIDVGSDDGVARDMPVVNADGLVGRVLQVTPGASRVLLAIDPNFAASSQLAGNAEQGTVDGRGGDLMRFSPFDPEASVEEGDELVTSSYTYGVFPTGIPIGSVERVGEQTTLLNRDIDVRPYVDFTRLNFVLVVRTEPIAEPPPPESDPDVPFFRPLPPDDPPPPPGPAPEEPPTEEPPAEAQPAEATG